jgi:hypothetical protein
LRKLSSTVSPSARLVGVGMKFLLLALKWGRLNVQIFDFIVGV